MNIIPLGVFATVASITPGPNNLMLWASGMNFGLRRTLPHVLGINIGFGVLVFAIGLGLGAVFEAFPIIETTLKWVGSAYLLYLAYRIATAAGGSQQESTSKPMTFWEAAAFQYVNPKAWVMAIASVGTFLPQDLPLIPAALSVALVFMIVNIPCVLVWVMAGTWMGRLLTHKRTRQVVNGVLGLLLAGTVFMMHKG